MKIVRSNPETPTGPILYLDLDGVLNRSGLGRVRPPARRPITPEVDPVAAELLNGLVDATGAVLVLTSSWRYRMSPMLLEGFLRARGVRGEIAGVTPRLIGRTRGDEIAASLLELGGNRPFVILDDGPPSDFGVLATRLVRTGGAVGLTVREVAACRALLG